MKQTFRLFQRGRMFYFEDTRTGKQKSLHTADKGKAQRLINAKNEAVHNPASVNLQIARTYIGAADPEMLSRNWGAVHEEMEPKQNGPTHERWERVGKDPAYQPLWTRPLMETQPMHLRDVIKSGTISTNVFLRRMHNFAFDMSWILSPIIAKKKWPKIKHGETRAITSDEHHCILANEKNQERYDYYELMWYLGGSQGDIAKLNAEDVNWEKGTVFYIRQKTHVDVMQRLGSKVKAVLERRSKSGPLFPNLRQMRASDRATEFKRACRRAQVSGVTPHSYRYAWAERAAENGFEERYAQAALGHNSKAVARAYARKAKTLIPALEEYEERNASKPNSQSSRSQTHECAQNNAP